MSGNSVLAMYDIHGIQKYIFRTTRVKDAMGASALIENVMINALEKAVEDDEQIQAGFDRSDLIWFDEHGAIEYQGGDGKIQVLFIGGGSAYVMFESKDLCISINRSMANHILKETYSLQLTTAMVSITGDYFVDMVRLREEMDRVKASTVQNLPYGALPIMKVEKGTGYPVVFHKDGKDGSTETRQKQTFKTLLDEAGIGKVVDQLVEQKGVDSMLAVVHIDGNNMGKNIREFMDGVRDYTDAVNRMRKLSYSIHNSFKKVFEQMYQLFHDKEGRQLIRKILVAGDDITYVCNGKAALASVEYFCKEISGYTMTGETDSESIGKYGFSVCAGIAFAGSHFPFSAAYTAAEACCNQAKTRAKLPENMVDGKIANFMDFQICKNIYGKDLESVRRKEYETYTGETLLIRPYYIPTDHDGDGFAKLKESGVCFDKLKEAVCYFRDETKIPLSHANNLRNTYPLGHLQMELLQSFLQSRGFKMPDGTGEMYQNQEAKWYDALEVMDYLYTKEEILKTEENPDETI